MCEECKFFLMLVFYFFFLHLSFTDAIVIDERFLNGYCISAYRTGHSDETSKRKACFTLQFLALRFHFFAAIYNGICNRLLL